MSDPIQIAVIVQRTPVANRWISEKWEAVAVIPFDSETQADPGVRELHRDAGSAQWLYPGFKLELYRDEAEGYYLNVCNPEPFVWVKMFEGEGEIVPGGAAGPRPERVTVSYNEASRWLDGGERVDSVPMPAQWVGWLGAFVQQHYRPEKKKKRARPPSFKGARRDE